MRRRDLRTAGLLTVAVGIGAFGLVGATGVSGAGASPDAPPAGYSVVTSAPVTAVNGRQTHAPVACPGTTKPVSGGAHIDSSSTLVNLNSSYPVGRNSWSVRVNNLSGADVTFEVYAVCIDRPAENYTVQTKAFPDRAHQVASVLVDCGSGTLVGGGVESNSVNPAISVHILAPTDDSAGRPNWNVWMNNPTTSPEFFTVYTICRKNGLHSVHVEPGSTTRNPAGTQTTATTPCGGESVPLSGGPRTINRAQGVSVSSSFPQGQSWSGSQNNTLTRPATLEVWVICSGR